MNLVKMLFLVAFLGTSLVSTAQVDDKLVATAARETCECMNKFLNQLHPKLIQMMHDMADLGMEEAEARFVEYLLTATPEDQEVINKDITRMENTDAELAVHCDAVYKRYEAYDTQQDFQDKFIVALKQNASCDLVAKMLKIGGK